jgi:alpha-glucosidase/alpha-D-xyloside xylohydrolase
MRVILLALLGLAFVPGLTAAPLRHAGRDVEMSLGQVSEHTMEVKLAPLGETVAPAQKPVATVLVDTRAEEKWRGREWNAPTRVTVGRMRCEIASSPLTLTIRRPDGTVVQQLVWSPTEGTLTFRADAPVFGLGEGAPGLDRRGSLYPMKDGWGAANRPVCGSRVSVPFLIGTEGWALFLPDLPGQEGEFDLRNRPGIFRAGKDAASLPLRIFVIVADEPAQIVVEYSRLIGRTPMPPKWTLGYMQSHRTLAGPEEVLQVARTFRDKQLPCDALIYLGTGYCPAGWNTGHGSLQFNPKTFDRPQEIIQRLHDLQFKVVLHVNHASRSLFGVSISEASENPWHIRNYWSRHSPVYAWGVDGWWPDDGDELPAESRLARHRCYYEGPLLDKPDLRPWSLHRTGYAGVQRYGGWIWSGDCDGRWATLAAHVAVGLNHSLSLTPFWGSDTGGFFPTRELTGELYVRWFQFSTFCPSFRSHGRTWHLRLPWGWNTGEFGPVEHNEGPAASELHNAAVEPICREYLNLRYRLLSYNYTLAREAHDTGLPLLRALWLHYPREPQAVACDNEYLWGRDLLVAPVVAQGVSERCVYLPAGDWYDWRTGEKIAGGRTIRRAVDLATLPLYVRAGSILPLDPVRQYVSQSSSEPTTIRVYPGADGRFILYDDDGQSLQYLKGSAMWIAFTWNDTERSLRITLDSRSSVKPSPRDFRVEVAPDNTPKWVTFDGAPMSLTFAKAAR